jgi:hypothetical protein
MFNDLMCEVKKVLGMCEVKKVLGMCEVKKVLGMCEVKKVLGMCEGGHFKIIVLSRQESADRINKRVGFIEFFATPQGLQ